MPAAVMPAAIGAVGSVAGGVSSGKGAARAAQIQANAQAQQTAALQNMYNENVARMTPTFNNGTNAQTRINTLLGLPGGDGSNAQATLAATPGYQFALNQSLGATNANAYASGLGESGAALKSLQDRANGLAEQNYNTYVGQLGTVADRGVQAMNGIVNQGNSTIAATNAVTQAGANAQSTDAVYQGNNLANILKGITNSAGQAYGSSYSSPAATNAFAQPASSGINLTPAGFTTGAWNSIVGG